MRTKLHAGAGIEVFDVDLGSLDEEAFASIRELFATYGLVFFRGQSLSEEQHIAFARRFGSINVNRFFTKNQTHPEIALVDKTPDDRANVGGLWHTDHSYDEVPALGSVLVARELPPRGGDTWFVNVADAFERLPERMKAKLRRMRARHSSQHVFGSKGAFLRKLMGREGQSHNPELSDAMDDVVHPAVIQHPLSGREALYVNPAFTLGFEGRGTLRSAPLLAYLYAHTIRPRHVAKFRWQPGSIAMWDNRTTWHYAQNDYPGHRRLMHRITLEGCALEPGRG